MVLGNVGEKVQRSIELAEELYEKVTRLREEVEDTKSTVEDTNDRVASLEAEVERQRAILEALAAERDVDVEALESDDASENDRTGGDPESG